MLVGILSQAPHIMYHELFTFSWNTTSMHTIIRQITKTPHLCFSQCPECVTVTISILMWQQRHGKALEKECCLLGIFCDSGDTPANLLCELNGHLMPCTSCFYGKWVEDVYAGQFGVLVYLVLCCLLGCCPWFSCCAANVWLSITAYVSGTVTSQATGFSLAHGKIVVPSGRLLSSLLFCLLYTSPSPRD